MMMLKLKWKLGMVANKIRRRAEEVLNSQEGVGTVEVVLLILVAVGLVLIFKDKITSLVNSIFSKITSQAGKV
ncbi:MAG: Flp1 family type IVb pilin [Eubacteriales bacterium]|nr:Flp1 family type IVb pilin [Eubacteriales bacterium]